MQNDLDILHRWAVDWQMEFNVDKCAVIHLGNRNLANNYILGDQILKSSNNERDLGVIADNKLYLISLFLI